MKKTIAILLVAVLAVSSVFAGFSGKATVGLGYNWETKEYGFSNGTGFDVDVDLSTAEAGNVNDAEGDIYAGIKATMSVKVANKGGAKGIYLWDSADKGKYGAGLFLKVAEAYVAGENWKVSITGTQGATSYAKSFETVKGDVKDVFGNVIDTEDVAYDLTGDFALNKAPGVTVEVAGFKASVGFEGSEDENRKTSLYVPIYEEVENTAGNKVYIPTGDTKKVDVVVGKYFNYNAFLETPEFNVDGLTLQAAVGASRNVKKETKNNHDFALNTSAKVGYTTDVLSVAVAADYDAVKPSKDNDTIISLFDTSAKVVFAPVTVDAYYGLDGAVAKTNEDGTSEQKLLAHKLSAQVATDLAAFDLPVKLTVYGKDIFNTMDYGAKAEVTIDAIKLGVNGGYVIDPNKYTTIGTKEGKYYLGADVEYTNELFTAKAGVGFNSFVGKGVEDKAQLTLKASVESDAIIPGATLKLAYGAGDEKQNLLKNQKINQQFGKVDATCTIKF